MPSFPPVTQSSVHHRPRPLVTRPARVGSSDSALLVDCPSGAVGRKQSGECSPQAGGELRGLLLILALKEALCCVGCFLGHLQCGPVQICRGGETCSPLRSHSVRRLARDGLHVALAPRYGSLGPAQFDAIAEVRHPLGRWRRLADMSKCRGRRPPR